MTSIARERRQGLRQIGVPVGDLEPFADGLESLQGGFGQFALEVTVSAAAEDPTACEAMSVHAAFRPVLIGTLPGIHLREARGVQFRSQVDQLRRRDEEEVVVADEVAAVAARLALSGPIGVLPELGLDPVVERRYFVEESAVSCGFSHHRLFLLIRSIFSAE